MARTERTDKHREKDHQLNETEFNKRSEKIKLDCVSGKAFWCQGREQMIPGDKICHKIQSTQGCKIGILNTQAQTGCPLWDAKLNSKTAAKPKSKVKGVGKLSYQTIMRNIFLDKGYSTLDNLVTSINDHPSRKEVDRVADAKNVSVGISILKNPNRVKAPLTIDFSRKLKLYFCLDVDGMREKMAGMEKNYDEAKKKADKALIKKEAEDKNKQKSTDQKPAKTPAKKPSAKKTTGKAKPSKK